MLQVGAQGFQALYHGPGRGCVQKDAASLQAGGQQVVKGLQRGAQARVRVQSPGNILLGRNVGDAVCDVAAFNEFQELLGEPCRFLDILHRPQIENADEDCPDDKFVPESFIGEAVPECSFFGLSIRNEFKVPAVVLSLRSPS